MNTFYEDFLRGPVHEAGRILENSKNGNITVEMLTPDRYNLIYSMTFDVKRG